MLNEPFTQTTLSRTYVKRAVHAKQSGSGGLFRLSSFVSCLCVSSLHGVSSTLSRRRRNN
eukprot:5087629-Prymnesium_polylepis.1